MSKKPKQMPEEFRTYEEAAEFWDTYDSADFLDILEEIEMKVDIQKRHYLIEVDMVTARLLQESASKKGVPVSSLADEILQKQLAEVE